MRFVWLLVFVAALSGVWTVGVARTPDGKPRVANQFTVYPIGWVRKTDGVPRSCWTGSTNRGFCG